MTDKDYSQFLLLHLIILDTNNARYLWKRIPNSSKDPKIAQTQDLRQIWGVGKALTKKNYAEAFKLLSDIISSQGDKGDKLMQSLVKVLREDHVLRMVQRAYSTIGYDDLKNMLGMQTVQDSEMKPFLQKKGFKMNGKFVEPPTEDTDRKRFELTEDRVDHLSKIVQFLEQQKHDFSLINQQ